MAVQVGLDKVQVSWNAPTDPRNGYRVTTTPNSVSTDVLKSPAIITIPTPGVYNIQVMSLSQHLPGKTVELEGVIVTGDSKQLLII